MKHRLVKRTGALEIPGLTDEILKRLKPPYDLIAEWAQYVPLRHLLAAYFGMLSRYEDHDDGTVTMIWRNVPVLGEDYLVPLDLHERTWKHYKDTWDERPLHIEPCHSLIFLDDGKPITVGLFFEAIARAIESCPD